MVSSGGMISYILVNAVSEISVSEAMAPNGARDTSRLPMILLPVPPERSK
jgi:hypothetical protein